MTSTKATPETQEEVDGKIPDEASVAKERSNVGPYPPGTRPSEGGEELDDQIIQHGSSGNVGQALRLLKDMRGQSMRPSVDAYVACIEACRKAFKDGSADALWSEMNAVYSRIDLFTTFPLSAGEKPMWTMQMVFQLVQMMRTDKVDITPDAFRAMISLSAKERLWQLSLLLLGVVDRGAIPVDFRTADKLLTALLATGHAEIAVLLYEKIMDNGDEMDDLRPVHQVEQCKIDFHNLTASIALCATRLILRDMIRKPKTRLFHRSANDLLLVVGKGLHSRERAVLKPVLTEVLTKIGLQPLTMVNNEGCLVIRSAALQDFVARVIDSAEYIDDNEQYP